MGQTISSLSWETFFRKIKTEVKIVKIVSEQPCGKCSFLAFHKMSYCSGCETRVIVINPRAYMYINPRTLSGENAPIAFMKYISLS